MKSILTFVLLSMLLFNIVRADSEESSESDSSEKNTQSTSAQSVKPEVSISAPVLPPGTTYYITENYEVSDGSSEPGQKEISVQYSSNGVPPAGFPSVGFPPFAFSQAPFPQFPPSPVGFPSRPLPNANFRPVARFLPSSSPVFQRLNSYFQPIAF